MDPLRVEFDLVTPMVLPAMPIHLDALLAYAATEDSMRYGSGSDRVRDLAIPTLESILGKHEQEGEWVWMASALLPQEVGNTSLRMWTRKTDPYDIAERMENGQIHTRAKFPLEKPFALNIDTVRGQLKNHFKHYAVREVGNLIAWCVGDAEEIHDMLDTYISHIGHRRRSGHGQVSAIRVVEDNAAHSQWKLRILPWQEIGYQPMQAACQPPYWAVENKKTVYCPPDIL
jgi:CRISPR type IV-associated protein Csf3